MQCATLWQHSNITNGGKMSGKEEKEKRAFRSGTYWNKNIYTLWSHDE